MLTALIAVDIIAYIAVAINRYHPPTVCIKNPPMKIENSVALVTGSNRGLGLALAEELLSRGAKKVYAAARKIDSVKLPGVVPIEMDVTDAWSVAKAAAQCPDLTLLVNNAGIALMNDSTLETSFNSISKEIFETNLFGIVHTTQAFVPIIFENGGGALVNVLSDSAWMSRPMLAAYSASKSAAWSYTNAVRVELREQKIQVLGLHVGFLDTDMTRGFDMKKTNPKAVAISTLDALERGEEEVIADEGTKALKASLGGPHPFYLNPPAIA